MGVDLKLLVVDGRIGKGGFSHSTFEFGRHYAMFSRLNAKARTIPGFNLSGFLGRIPDGTMEGEYCYGDIKETPYGKPLTYVSAKEFCDIADQFKIGWDMGKAAVAYLKCLKPDELVALYYH